VVFHIIGAKCGIHKNKPILIELEHGLKLCRCLDAYGEKDMDLIHLICILEIKNIIRMSTKPWLNRKCWVFVQPPSALLVILVQVNDILEL
jgi:hypothetical protein